MRTSVPRILLTGPPRAGKSTLACRLAQGLTAIGIAVGGFVTHDIRENGERVGFTIEEIGGPRALLAHVALPAGPQVGRYRVDLAAFESVALPAIERAIARQSGVAIIDELGQMELFSSSFIHSFEQLISRAIPLVATVHARQHPITDAIKQSPDFELLQVRRDNADELLAHLTAQLSI